MKSRRGKWINVCQMKKKRLIVIMLLFFLLTSLEMGIFIELLWHSWGGYADISKEYTETAGLGIAFLVFFIPVSIIVILLIRIMLCIKKISSIKGVLFDCISALSGIGISIVIFFQAPSILIINPIFQLGRLMVAFLIEFFSGMEYPIP